MIKLFGSILCVIAFTNTVYSQETDSSAIPPNTPWSKVCLLPFETGICKAAATRYYYNDDTLECETFTYGGCGGNYNNFQTKDECLKFCSRGALLSVPPAPPTDVFIRPNRGDSREVEINPVAPSSQNPPPQQAPAPVTTANNNNNNNGNSSGNHNRAPLFGGLLAGVYSLARNLLFW